MTICRLDPDSQWRAWVQGALIGDSHSLDCVLRPINPIGLRLCNGILNVEIEWLQTDTNMMVTRHASCKIIAIHSRGKHGPNEQSIRTTKIPPRQCRGPVDP